MSDLRRNNYLKEYNRYTGNNKKVKKWKVFLAFLFLISIIVLAYFSFNKYFFKETKPQPHETTQNISNIDIKSILTKTSEEDFTKKYFTKKLDNETIVFHTSINPKLQNYLKSQINTALNSGYGAPEVLCFAVINPKTGEIIGLQGYSSQTGNDSPCTKATYPAASLFKIVSAAAASDLKGYNPDKTMWFNGGKYTLYKRQLTSQKNRYTNYIKLKNAFAQSVNPVFGKIGYFDLQDTMLVKYAHKFGFNSDITKDIPVKQSTIEVSESNYQWAEVACGFNNSTRISVLHAALISSIIVNDGKLIYPHLIQKAVDDKRNVRYTASLHQPVSIIKKESADAVKEMMYQTIQSGTAKGSFSSYRKGKTMKDLLIGGKTGSLLNIDNTIKYDWFSGFAQDKNTNEKIVFAILVGHGHYLGKKSASYGRQLISNYFNNLS